MMFAERDDTVVRGKFPIRHGTIVYTRCGSQWEIQRILSEEEWLVCPVVEVPEWDGSPGPVMPSGASVIMPASNFYPQPPKSVVYEEIAKQQELLKSIRAEVAAARADLQEFAREEKQRQERLTRHEQLTHLVDWIDGKITHLAVSKYDGWYISEVGGEDSSADESRRGSKVLKLLTLWGKSDGNLNWRLSQYSDGSGIADNEVIPCASYDDALEEIKKRIDQEVEVWRAEGKSSLLARAHSTADRYNIPLPDDVLKHHQACALLLTQNELDKARAALAAAAERFHKARNA
jgi:hypothetical protein